MREGMTTFGIILLIVGVGLLFLNNYYLTTTTVGPEGRQTQGFTLGIPNGLVWFVIIAGAVITAAGLLYEPMRHRAVRTR